MAAFLLLIGVGQSQGRVWVGGTSSDWFDGSNWNPAGIPQSGDDVTIPSAASAPLLTSSTPALASLTVSTGTLTCTNWDTVINATVITIQNTGKITLPDAFADNVMSNRIHIICSDLTVNAGGQIDASERGYAVNFGPGKGGGDDKVAGSGYGGQGEYAWHYVYRFYAGGSTYGSETAPNEPGSGGPLCNSGYTTPGKGGGVIRIEATGTVTVHGTIAANGGHVTGWHGGGGSGGAIYISCSRVQGGSDGLITAQGGNYPYSADMYTGGGGAGGGGRIAVTYATSDLPSLRLSTAAGAGYFNPGGDFRAAGMGTIYLSTTDALTPFLSTISGRLIVPGLSSWSPATLTVSNCAIGFGTNFQLNVAGNLVVTGATTQLRLGAASTLACAGNLQVEGGKILLESNSAVTCNAGTVNGGELVVKGDFTCATDLTLTNGASFYVYSGSTNAVNDYGALVVVPNRLSVLSSSWVFPCSEPNTGGSPLFRVNALIIATNGGFNAVGRGYGVGKGPGSRLGNGDKVPGGSHAGKGGQPHSRELPGPTYGSSNAPVEVGSGAPISFNGATMNVGPGGGLIRLEVTGYMTLNGILNASGENGYTMHSGGGAGGSVFVIANKLNSGTDSAIYAKGGQGGGYLQIEGGGGGGGGRIALWVGFSKDSVSRYLNTGLGSRPEPFDKFLGTMSVTNGLGFTNGPPVGAESGTILLLWSPGEGTLFTVR